MKLWILRRIQLTPDTKYDVKNGAVVRAEDEQAARAIVAEAFWNEGTDTWLDGRLSTCEELSGQGEPGLLLEDNNPG